MVQRDWLRRLPNGKPISALGFGCASIFAKPFFDEAQAQRILAAAVDEGINHLDTGPSYGPAHGERRLGIFLKGRDATKLVVATKVGTNFLDGKVVRGFTQDLMERSLAGSMKRLGVDHVDILYLHGPEIPDLNDEVFAFFDRMKAAGRITYSAVNSFAPPVLDAVAASPIDAVMLQYNATDLSLESQIDRLDAAGKIVMSGTALGRAKFAFSTFLPRNRAHAWYMARMLRYGPDFLWRGPVLARRLSATGKPPTEAAIQFVTGHPKIRSNLFGTSSVRHVVENARAGHGALTDEQWTSLSQGRRPPAA